MGQNKVTRSLRVSPDTAEAVETMAEERDITKSEAYRRVIRQGVEVQQSDVTVIKGQDGDAIPDGGELQTHLTELEEQTETVADKQHRAVMSQFWLMLAVFWLGLELVLSPPAIWTVPSGIGLFAGLSYNLYREYQTHE